MDEFINKEQLKEEGYLYEGRANSLTEPQVQKKFDAQEADGLLHKKTIADEIKEHLPEGYPKGEQLKQAEDNEEKLPAIQQVIQKRDYRFLYNNINDKIVSLENKFNEIKQQYDACQEVLSRLSSTKENHTAEDEVAIWLEMYQDTTKEAEAAAKSMANIENELTLEKESLNKLREFIDKETEISNTLMELVDSKNSIKAETEYLKLQDYYDKAGMVEEYMESFKRNFPGQLRNEDYTKTITDYETFAKELSDTMGIVSIKLLDVENINSCCDINSTQEKLNEAQNAENEELIKNLEKDIKIHKAMQRTILRRLNVMPSGAGTENRNVANKAGQIENDENFKLLELMQKYDEEVLIDMSAEDLKDEAERVCLIIEDSQRELAKQKQATSKLGKELKLKQDISYDMDFIKQLPSVIERLNKNAEDMPEPDYASRLNYIADVVHMVDIRDRYNELSKMPFLYVADKKKLKYISVYCKNHCGDFYKTVEKYSMEVFKFQASDLLKQNVDIPGTCSKLTNFNDPKSFAKALVDFYTYNAGVDLTKEVRPVADIISAFGTNPDFTDSFKVQVLYELGLIKATLANDYDRLYRQLDDALDSKKIQGSGRAKMLHYMASLTPLGARLRAIEYSSDIIQSEIDLGDANNLVEKVKVLAVTDETIVSSKKHTDRMTEDINSATTLLKSLYGRHFEKGVFALTKVLEEINARVPQTLFADDLEDIVLSEIEEELNAEINAQARQKRIEAIQQRKQDAQKIFAESENITAKIKELMVAQHKVLSSTNIQEKRQFLDEVDKIEQYIFKLDSVCGEKAKKTDAYKNTLAALNTQMDRLSEGVAQVAFETIDFRKMEDTYRRDLAELKIEEANEQMVLEPRKDEIELLKNNLLAWRNCIDLIRMKRDGYILNVSKKEIADSINGMPNAQKTAVINFQNKLETMTKAEIAIAYDQICETITSGEKMLEDATKNLQSIRTKIHYREKFLKQFNNYKNAMAMTYELEADRDEALESQDIVKKLTYFNKVASLQESNLLSFPIRFPELNQDERYIILSKRYISMCQKKAGETAHQMSVAITRQMVKPIKQPIINIDMAINRLSDANDIKKMFTTAFNYKLYNGEKCPEEEQLKRIYDQIEDVLFAQDSMDVESEMEFTKEIYKARSKAAKELVALYNSLDRTYGQKLDKRAICYLASRSQAYAKYMTLNMMLTVQNIWGKNKEYEKLLTKYTTQKSVVEDFKITKLAEDITGNMHKLEELVWPDSWKKDELYVMYKEANQQALRRALGI